MQTYWAVSLEAGIENQDTRFLQINKLKYLKDSRADFEAIGKWRIAALTKQAGENGLK